MRAPTHTPVDLTDEQRANLASAHDLLELAYQYVSDLRYPPTGDSVQRRIERAEAVIAKATGYSSALPGNAPSRGFFPSDAQILRGEAQLDFEQCDPCEGTGVNDDGAECICCKGVGTVEAWSLRDA